MNTSCTSACGNDYDCPHEYDEVKLKVQHLPSDYPKAEQLDPMIAGVDFGAELEFISDQEAKHGEERVPSND